jgi:hypothetical protein
MHQPKNVLSEAPHADEVLLYFSHSFMGVSVRRITHSVISHAQAYPAACKRHFP